MDVDVLGRGDVVGLGAMVCELHSESAPIVLGLVQNKVRSQQQREASGWYSSRRDISTYQCDKASFVLIFVNCSPAEKKEVQKAFSVFFYEID